MSAEYWPQALAAEQAEQERRKAADLARAADRARDRAAAAEQAERAAAREKARARPQTLLLSILAIIIGPLGILWASPWVTSYVGFVQDGLSTNVETGEKQPLQPGDKVTTDSVGNKWVKRGHWHQGFWRAGQYPDWAWPWWIVFFFFAAITLCGLAGVASATARTSGSQVLLLGTLIVLVYGALTLQSRRQSASTSSSSGSREPQQPVHLTFTPIPLRTAIGKGRNGRLVESTPTPATDVLGERRSHNDSASTDNYETSNMHGDREATPGTASGGTAEPRRPGREASAGDGASVSGMYISRSGDFVQLNSDGTFILRFRGRSMGGSFAIEGQDVILSHPSDPRPAKARLTDSGLTFPSGKTYVKQDVVRSPTSTTSAGGAGQTDSPSPTRHENADSGGLKLRVEPDDAAIYLDNSYIGKASEFGSTREIALDAGKHTVTVTRNMYQSRTVEVTIEAGRVANVGVRLDR